MCLFMVGRESGGDGSVARQPLVRLLEVPDIGSGGAVVVVDVGLPLLARGPRVQVGGGGRGRGGGGAVTGQALAATH